MQWAVMNVVLLTWPLLRIHCIKNSRWEGLKHLAQRRGGAERRENEDVNLMRPMEPPIHFPSIPSHRQVDSVPKRYSSIANVKTLCSLCASARESLFVP
jgi:hypothetical protein